MKKNNKKIIVIIIVLVCLLICGIVVYLLTFKKPKEYYTKDKILRFYEWKESQYVEYKYNCKKDSCKAIEISNKLYLLLDDNKFLYNPIDNDKQKVDFDGDNVDSVIKDSDNNTVALVLADGDNSDGNKSIYFVKENKTYFKDKKYKEINLIGYEEYNEKTEESKYYIINYDYVVAKDENYNVYVIDYKKNEIIFDSAKLDYKNDGELSINFDVIKVKDNLFYYKVECGNGKSFILNDKFKTISSYSSKGQMGQFGEGNQYLIYKSKIYVVNPDDKSFSIYDSNGKLIKKSEAYKHVYCLAEGYVLVNMNIDEINYDVVIDDNGKELFKVEANQGDLSTSMYYDEKNNSLVIDYVTGLDSGIDYIYSFKTKQVTKKVYDYMDY